VVADQLRISYEAVSIASGEPSLGDVVLALHQADFKDVESTPTLEQKDLAERLAVQSFAGDLAERRFRRKFGTTRKKSDRDLATEFLSHFRDPETRTFSRYCAYVKAVADEHVRHPENWFYIRAVADELVKETSLSAARVKTIIQDSWKDAVQYAQSRTRHKQVQLDAASAQVVDDFFGS
jgi:hypothetical protein